MSECYIECMDGMKCRCDDCGHECMSEDLDMVSDIEQRLDAGGTVPAGQCPECGALAYLETPPTGTAEHELMLARALIDEIKGALGTDEGGMPLVQVAKLAHKAEQSTIAFTKLVGTIARMTPYEPDGDNGISPDPEDAVDTMNSLIEQARKIVGATA